MNFILFDLILRLFLKNKKNSNNNQNNSFLPQYIKIIYLNLNSKIIIHKSATKHIIIQIKYIYFQETLNLKIANALKLLLYFNSKLLNQIIISNFLSHHF
jgi:hypothetical protein